ncbi:DUF2169 domain-containing protein [Sorangium sp. So ce1182]|uniref:DUF2169 family type VI secretion system accessory protein n=1 Tax=Sorangium sp. So ce1182 TaxID=3133334 RepID=UPI003F5D9B36
MDLISECALRVAKVGWQPRHGSFAFTVVCKATFELRPDLSPLAATQVPVVEADVSTGDYGALALASELVPLKKRPEVLVAGHAYAPEGRPVPSLVARLSAGEIDKAIQVVGDRYFGRDGLLGEPAGFTTMPLVWERAAGGPGTPNPAGRPLGSAARADLSGRVPAPNLLPVGLRFRSRSDIVPPVGFGPIAPTWPSRAAYFHRHAAWWSPSRWHERPLPDDIDLGYFNAAPSDQQRAQPFGEEVIYLENMHPRFARLSTRLAPVAPVATVDHGSGMQRLQLRCDTLVIDTDRGLAMLVWRAHVLLDRADRAGRVVVTGTGAPDAAPSARDHDALNGEGTLAPAAAVFSSVVLPFVGAAARASSSIPPRATAGKAAPAYAGVTTEHPPTQPSMGATPPPVANNPLERTEALGLVVQPSMLPFAPTQAPSASRRDVSPRASTSGLPFAPPPAQGDLDAAPRSSRPDLQRPPPSLPSMATDVPWMASTGSTTAEGRSSPASALPCAAPPEPPRPLAPLSTQAAEPLPASVPSPFAKIASQPPYRPAAEASARSERWFAPASSPVGELPDPPPLLGAITPVSASPAEAPANGRPPAAESDAKDFSEPEADPPPDVAFEAYPPERCAAIAACLACDEGSTNDVLHAEELDDARWQRIHAYWLDRIGEEVARCRKRLLSIYDSAYVSALEAKRGPITLDDYARLAEAAERSAIAGALAERGLPQGAWPHVHRVWIGRMVKDVRLGKQLWDAIDALRGAG